MAGGNLSQSRKKRRTKKGKKKSCENKQTNNPKCSLVLETVYTNTSEFRFRFLQGKNPVEECPFPLFPPGFTLVFLKSESFFLITDTRTETVLVRNLGFGGAVSFSHPVLCYQS